MSNDFFNFTSGQFLTRLTLARSAAVNSLLSAIAAGFDKLPSETNLNFNTTTYYVAAGVANAYTVTMVPAPVAYSDGLHLRIKIPATNTGASTIDVNGLGARSIRRFDRVAVAAGDLTEDDVLDLVYEGTYWVMQTPARSLIDVVQAAQYAAAAASSASDASDSADAAEVSATEAAASAASIVGLNVGKIFAAAYSTPRTGELECNGQEVSRATYADLFSIIGTTWGVGDGSTTFNLPDLRGEFLRGWDNGRGIDSGRAFASSQLDQMQRITGNIQIRAINTGSPAIYSDAGAMDVSGGGVGSQPTIQGSSESRTRDKIEFDSADSPNARTSTATTGETRPRNVAIMYVIMY